MSHWIKFLGKFYKDKQKTNKDYTYKQAMKDAAKEYKHKGGAATAEPTPKPTEAVSTGAGSTEAVSAETVGGSTHTPTAAVSQNPVAYASASVNSPALFQKGGKKSKTAKKSKSKSKRVKTCKNKSCKK